MKHLLIISLLLFSTSAYSNICDRHPDIIKAVQNEYGKENIYHKKCEDIDISALKKVQSLIIENPFVIDDKTTFNPKELEGLTNLTNLDLPNLHIAPEKISSYAPQLKVLSLGTANLVTLPINIFDGLFNLEELYLNSLVGGALSSLDERVFSNLINLKVLTLRNNKLTQLPNKIFKGLSKLEYLDFGFQKPYGFVQTLSKDFFSDLISLRYLNMSNNLDLSFEKGVFTPMKNLKSLNLWSVRLSKNSVDQIQSEVPQAEFYYHIYDDNFSTLEHLYKTTNSKSLTVPKKNSFYSGRCFNEGDKEKPLIGGILLDSNPDQYAVVILQQPSENYPLDYADNISSEDDGRLKWLVVNNAHWGRYFYETAELNEAETKLYSNDDEYSYSIKVVGEELLVHFKLAGEIDEGIPFPPENINVFCRLKKNY